MRHDKISTSDSMPLQPCVFICTCCEINEHSLTEQLPQGWSIEFIDGTGYAFCEDCAIDLPGHHNAAGAFATRIGVASQLDAAEMLDMDEDDRRHAQRLAGIARAERVGRHVFPMLLAVMVLLGAASLLSQTRHLIAL
jgi:hypothetical protein